MAMGMEKVKQREKMDQVLEEEGNGVVVLEVVIAVPIIIGRGVQEAILTRRQFLDDPFRIESGLLVELQTLIRTRR